MRRETVLLAAAAAVLTTSPAQAAVTLDGVRRVEYAYTGSLSEPVVFAARMQFGDPIARATRPAPGDCEQSSCNATEILLQLPHGRETGTLEFSVVAQPHPAAPQGYADPVAYGVYDASGAERGYWAPGERPPSVDRPANLPNQRPMTASEPVVVARLAPGRYTFVVFDLGGPTDFAAKVSWHPNRPSRARP